MRKILTTVLAAALLVGTFALCGVGSSAAELALHQNAQYGQLSSTGGCGFVDGNLYFTTGLDVAGVADIQVEVNGKAAHWNIGYMGEKHCGLKDANNLPKSWIQIGIIGAELVVGENTLKITAGNDTYTQKFTSTAAAKSVASSKVDADKGASSVTAVITYTDDPGYKVGDELTGKCHDDHNNTATFKVTAVDGKKVTLVAENYEPGQSLLELKDKDGVYTTVTINSAVDNRTPLNIEKDTSKLTKIEGITDVACADLSAWGDGAAANLFDGDTAATKIGGGVNNGKVTVTFRTGDATTVNYYTLYTGGDTATNAGRNPTGWVLYGSTDGENYTEIAKVATDKQHVTGLGATNSTPYTYAVDKPGAYSYYKIEFLTTGTQFQLNEMVLFSEGTSTENPGGEDPVQTSSSNTTSGTDPVTSPVTTTGTAPMTTPGTSGTSGSAPVTSGSAPITTATPPASSNTPASSTPSTPSTSAAPATTGNNGSDSEGGSALPIIIAVVAVVVIGGGVAAVLIIKKKKA